MIKCRSSLHRRFAAVLLMACGTAAGAKPLHVPVLKQDFADPHVIEHRGRYIAYATNRGTNLPMATSRDLVKWEMLRDPQNPGQFLDGMPKLAGWVKEGRTWAPEVIEAGGRWLLYYTAHHEKKDRQCVGLAIAEAPTGPFRDMSAEPLVCQDQLGGTIDAHPFRDADGQLYLYYKNDGNNPKVLKPSHIWAQRLAPDGLRLVGEPAPLVRNDVHWEWRVVEAPAMVRRPDGGYTLFFSANHYGWEADQRLSTYGTGYAQCAGPMGPCTDAPENPILHSYNKKGSGCLSGPGHPTVFRAGEQSYIAFHAWSATGGCRKLDNERFLYVAPLSWQDGKPVIGPSLRPAKQGARSGRHPARTRQRPSG
jgi:beta-xylosidase